MIAVSCYFGTKLTGLYKAPMDSKCYFFSNNAEIKNVVEIMGWEFVLIKQFPLSSEPRIASLQSKYIKFLQFDKSEIGWSGGESILYFDHKFEVKFDQMKTASELCKNQLLIRNTPSEKFHIQDEIIDALQQKRYKEVMTDTINWVNQKVLSGGFSGKNRIMNTGFIFYANVEIVQALCDEVYRTCWLLGQPECQIIWGLLSQPYEKNITRIDWQTLDIPWKEPTQLESGLR